jgi:phage terminase small subunit
MPRTGLTPKQERFVQEYLIDLNATQAAIRAGYSKKTANEQGARLLANASVAAAVKEALARRAEKSQMKAEEVLAELAAIANADMDTYGWWDETSVRATPKNLLPPGASRCIKEIAGGKYGTTIKLYDKLAAIRDLARHLGMVGADGPQVNVTVNNSDEQRREFFIRLGQILADTPDKKAAVGKLIREQLNGEQVSG